MDEISEDLVRPKEKVIATSKEDLPPLKDGYVRIVHITNPEVIDRIKAEGLNYENQGHLTATARVFSKAEDVQISNTDHRFSAPSLKAVVMDVPGVEAKLHDNVFKSPGVIPAEYLVGVLDNKD